MWRGLHPWRVFHHALDLFDGGLILNVGDVEDTVFGYFLQWYIHGAEHGSTELLLDLEHLGGDTDREDQIIGEHHGEDIFICFQGVLGQTHGVPQSERFVLDYSLNGDDIGSTGDLEGF